MLGGRVEVDEATRQLHRDCVVVDLHNDLLHKLTLRSIDLAARHEPQAIYNPLRFDIDLPRLREGGVDALGCLLFAGLSGTAYDLRARRFWRQVDELARLLRTHPDELCLATSTTQIRGAAKVGKVALFIGVEGAHAVELEGTLRAHDVGGESGRGHERPADSVRDQARERGALSALERLYEAGVRYFGPLWDRSCRSGVSARDTKREGGLSAEGRVLVRELNRLGILVDVSHASRRTVLDLSSASHTPPFSSHSGARAVHDHPRNLSDDELRELGRAGGVVGVIFASTMLGLPWCSIERLCDHIDHIATIAGPEAVAFGSDFDGFVPLVRGIRDVRDLPRITQTLRNRGWTEPLLRGLLGENFLRYFDTYAGRAT